MKRVQIFLSVNAAKWLIAEAISRLAGSSDRTGKWNINFEGRNHNLLSQRHSDGIAPEAVRPGNMPRGCGQFERELQSTYGTSQPAGHTVPGWLGERCLFEVWTGMCIGYWSEFN